MSKDKRKTGTTTEASRRVPGGPGVRALLDGMNKVLREALVCESVEEVAQKCLEVAQSLTGSRFGFVGEINQEGKLDTLAISDPGWSACRIDKTDAVMSVRNMEVRGLWGRVVLNGASSFVNEPAGHPDSVGVPVGHPDLTSFLGVPLKQDGKVTGIIAVANNPKGYKPGHLQALEELSATFTETLRRKRIEIELASTKDVLKEVLNERTRQLEASETRYATVIRSLPQGMVHVLDRDFSHVFGAGEALVTLGLSSEDLYGRQLTDLMTAESAQKWKAHREDLLAGSSISLETTCRDQVFMMNAVPLFDGDDEVDEILVLSVNITERKIAEEQIRQLNEELEQRVADQAETILELSAPSILLWKHILLLPLIGVLDTRRAQLATEHLLESIVAHEARIVLIDVTGVSVVDSSVAQHLVKAVRAASMLGTEVLVSGLSAHTAVTLSQLGVNTEELRTCGTLRTGLALAFKILSDIAPGDNSSSRV